MKRSELRLRDHQQKNLDYFRSKARALSLLPYGAGKSPIAVLRIGDLVPPKRALLVCTTGVVYKWLREFKTWGDPEWKVVPLVGKNEERMRIFENPHNVAVINYEGLGVMLDGLGEKFAKAYKVVIFDEIHRLKNPDADISKNAAYISHPKFADFVYGLTGAPVYETPLDLFSIRRVVNPWMFGLDYEAWRERSFCEAKSDGKYPRWVCRPGAMDFLAEKLHSIAFRLEKDECNVDYPKQIFNNPITASLTGKSRAVYQQAEKRLALALTHQVLSLVHIYPRLEKLCQLSRGWCYDSGKTPLYFPEMDAIRAFADYAEEIRGAGPLCVWAVRPPDMAMLGNLFDRMGMKYRIVHGGIRSAKARDGIVESFNRGACDALIAHPRCIGEGVDVHGRFSFRYSYRWSAMEWDQPLGRFARISSNEKIVDYRDLVMEETLDEGIVMSVRSKLDVGELIKKSRKIPWRFGPAGGEFDAVQA